ncbi:MAG: AhpC/TSA family protein [Syntrophorhabdaceae bacterium PtaU1.Bin034]|nr:MAG: AhpC/TSA family protein [Syntrophorhabdaceae bacterium PtaU1.Bin034]
MRVQGDAILVPGNPFPDLDLDLVIGKRVLKILFPGRSGGKWSFLLFYCSSSCPVCCQQLVDFQKMIREGRNGNVRVLAACGDDREQVMKTMWDLKISFPVAYGVDAARSNGGTWAVHDDEGSSIHPAGFLIDPEGKIANAFRGSGQCFPAGFVP